jgi:hypothetical protein
MDDYRDALRCLSTEELEALIEKLNVEQLQRSQRWWERKRQRDAERHMDVHCPACGANPRTRCLKGTKRVETSHRERAWKTHACPVCDAAPGEWCKVGPVNGSNVHVARAQAATFAPRLSRS